MYVPSGAAAPVAVSPFQASAPVVAPVTVHDRITVVPRRIRAVPLIRSEADQASRVVSADASPFGENRLGVAAAWSVAGVPSTRTVHDRETRLAAWSRALSVRRYRPSATADPSLARPVHSTAALLPVPDRVVTAGPTVEPASGAALKAQRVAPLAPMATRMESRMPSPLGEMRVPLSDEAVIVGATVSIVTA